MSTALAVILNTTPDHVRSIIRGRPEMFIVRPTGHRTFYKLAG